ncbi:MAG TPA: YfiR family protein [Candidatus Acidoferrales bacterium]|nr:YfiR family protein [Candidatus Acidoferrales bacterium]
MRKVPFIVACLVCLSLIAAAPSHAQNSDSSDSSEYLIKAGFTYNFAKLMEWPAGSFAQSDSPIVIGVLGTDPFNGTLDQVLKGKQANGRAFEVKHLKWGADLRGCNILFVSDSETGHLDELFHSIKGLPILTIGETPGFAQRGGIINFVVEDNRVRFEIDVDAAKQANINISSRLLSLANIVHEVPADGRKP